MTNLKLKDEASFIASMSIAERMKKDGLLNDNEYEKIRFFFLNKYAPLFSGSDLDPAFLGELTATNSKIKSAKTP